MVLHRSPDKDWNVEEEMKGWRLGEGRVCLPTTMTGKTASPMHDVQRDLWKMQHRWFCDVSSVLFLLTETEAEMVTGDSVLS